MLYPILLTLFAAFAGVVVTTMSAAPFWVPADEKGDDH